MPFLSPQGTANLDPNRAFSPTAITPARRKDGTTCYARFLQMLLNEGELDGVRVSARRRSDR